jgi:Zn-finger nucleic acid-binding protein
VRLVACSQCHTQYDVTHVAAEEFACRCGATVENKVLTPVDATIRRCGSCGAIAAEDATTCDFCGSAIVRDTRDLSLICPECYARNSERSRFCTACGVAFRPQAVVAGAAEIACPCCSCAMAPRAIGGVAVNECPECNGLWVPGESFDDLVNRAIAAQRHADPDGLGAPQPRVSGGNPVSRRVQYRRCPLCQQFMARRNFQGSSGVVIDRCHEHGTWLDADELEEIAGFVLSGGLARARQAAAAREEGERKIAQRERADAELQRILVSRPQQGGRGLLVSFVDFLNELLSSR